MPKIYNGSLWYQWINSCGDAYFIDISGVAKLWTLNPQGEQMNNVGHIFSQMVNYSNAMQVWLEALN